MIIFKNINQKKIEEKNIQSEWHRYITEVQVTVRDTKVGLHIGVNESYTLNTGKSVVELTAETRFGVVRGLETFYQLYNVTG